MSSPKPRPAPPDATRQRADGTIRPLPVSQLHEIYGRRAVQSLQNGRVRALDDWPQRHLVDVTIPALARLGAPRVTLHRKAAPVFKACFAEIEARGLSDRIRTYNGAYVARRKGWNPRRTLSAHAFGIAIDMNAKWNGYGVAPAPIGADGSVRELVAIFNAWGFAWGGHFKPAKYFDGMHFELARRDL